MSQILLEAFNSIPYPTERTEKNGMMDISYTFEDETNHSFRFHFEKRVNYGRNVFVLTLGQKSPNIKMYKRVFGKFHNPLRVIATLIDIVKDNRQKRSDVKGLIIEVPEQAFGAHGRLVDKIIKRELRTELKVQDLELSIEEFEKMGLKGVVATVKPYQFDSVFNGKIMKDILDNRDAKLDAAIAMSSVPEKPVERSVLGTPIKSVGNTELQIDVKYDGDFQGGKSFRVGVVGLKKAGDKDINDIMDEYGFSFESGSNILQVYSYPASRADKIDADLADAMSRINRFTDFKVSVREKKVNITYLVKNVERATACFSIREEMLVAYHALVDSGIEDVATLGDGQGEDKYRIIDTTGELTAQAFADILQPLIGRAFEVRDKDKVEDLYSHSQKYVAEARKFLDIAIKNELSQSDYDVTDVAFVEFVDPKSGVTLYKFRLTVKKNGKVIERQYAYVTATYAGDKVKVDRTSVVNWINSAEDKTNGLDSSQYEQTLEFKKASVTNQSFKYELLTDERYDIRLRFGTDADAKLAYGVLQGAVALQYGNDTMRLYGNTISSLRANVTGRQMDAKVARIIELLGQPSVEKTNLGANDLNDPSNTLEDARIDITVDEGNESGTAHIVFQHPSETERSGIQDAIAAIVKKVIPQARRTDGSQVDDMFSMVVKGGYLTWNDKIEEIATALNDEHAEAVFQPPEVPDHIKALGNAIKQHNETMTYKTKDGFVFEVNGRKLTFKADINFNSIMDYVFGWFKSEFDTIDSKRQFVDKTNGDNLTQNFIGVLGKLSIKEAISKKVAEQFDTIISKTHREYDLSTTMYERSIGAPEGQISDYREFKGEVVVNDNGTAFAVFTSNTGSFVKSAREQFGSADFEVNGNLNTLKVPLDGNFSIKEFDAGLVGKFLKAHDDNYGVLSKRFNPVKVIKPGRVTFQPSKNYASLSLQQDIACYLVGLEQYQQYSKVSSVVGFENINTIDEFYSLCEVLDNYDFEGNFLKAFRCSKYISDARANGGELKIDKNGKELKVTISDDMIIINVKGMKLPKIDTPFWNEGDESALLKTYYMGHKKFNDALAVLDNFLDKELSEATASEISGADDISTVDQKFHFEHQKGGFKIVTTSPLATMLLLNDLQLDLTDNKDGSVYVKLSHFSKTVGTKKQVVNALTAAGYVEGEHVATPGSATSTPKAKLDTSDAKPSKQTETGTASSPAVAKAAKFKYGISIDTNNIIVVKSSHKVVTQLDKKYQTLIKKYGAYRVTTMGSKGAQDRLLVAFDKNATMESIQMAYDEIVSDLGQPSEVTGPVAELTGNYNKYEIDELFQSMLKKGNPFVFAKTAKTYASTAPRGVALFDVDGNGRFFDSVGGYMTANKAADWSNKYDVANAFKKVVSDLSTDDKASLATSLSVYRLTFDTNSATLYNRKLTGSTNLSTAGKKDLAFLLNTEISGEAAAPILEYLNENIEVGTKKYILNSKEGVQYLNNILNKMVSLIPDSSDSSYSIGGAMRQKKSGGIRVVVNDMHRGGYYEGDTHVAIGVQIGGAYTYAILKGVSDFLKSVFSNLTQIGEDIKGRIFEKDGSNFWTIGVAYVGKSYFPNPEFSNVAIKSNFLKLDKSLNEGIKEDLTGVAPKVNKVDKSLLEKSMRQLGMYQSSFAYGGSTFSVTLNEGVIDILPTSGNVAYLSKMLGVKLGQDLVQDERGGLRFDIA